MAAKITRKRLLEFLTPLASEQRTLEIGAGDRYYRDLFPNAVAVDSDPARKPDTVADAHELPFGDGSFEQILCVEVLEHLRDPQRAIDEMRRVLKTGGRLILTTRFIFPVHDAPGDYYRFTEYGLRYLLRDWRIDTFRSEGSTFDALEVLLQRIQFQIRFKANKVLKGILLIVSGFLRLLGRVPRIEYGDIKRETKVSAILSSGYYLTATKKN